VKHKKKIKSRKPLRSYQASTVIFQYLELNTAPDKYKFDQIKACCIDIIHVGFL
jgi:hypothetical protein